MKLDAKSRAVFAASAVFVGLPLLFYFLGEYPRRNILKESLSLATLLSLSLVLGQFFLSRGNEALTSLFKLPAIQKVHKFIGYTVLSVLFLHPALIVLPRAFEGGVEPWDAFFTMITSFDNLGIVVGLGAWLTMVVLGVSSWFRLKLMKQFANRYKGWRYFHGGLALVFAGLGVWHAILLGRHTDLVWILFLVGAAAFGALLLGRLYVPAFPKSFGHLSLGEGAKS